jgi:hypothetical protein
MSNSIVNLNVTLSIGNIATVVADGQEVYRGSDLKVVNRWHAYFTEQTSWLEIVKKEQNKP